MLMLGCCDIIIDILLAAVYPIRLHHLPPTVLSARRTVMTASPAFASGAKRISLRQPAPAVLQLSAGVNIY